MLGPIGSNGAGKSTLIKILATLSPPGAGPVLVAGAGVVGPAAEVRRHGGQVPPLLPADGAPTGYEKMLLSARLYVIPRNERRARIAETPDRPVQHYSGGMIRRLEIGADTSSHRQ
ncbi:ATP-binding cassette domain-containing protein [Azospirillum sp. YIM B02556]|uniref:ATP-binding cassette domain-containing protein n=1 Tax=Azospirillum endophyticum TaxID=2800326 RepID=A0ABS1FEP1_9PROT|nr:ATP-binding cassette domain-containing protein [Azospirillum endophyticum]MBK1841911.1 ATP-binding cassette domain-containing protein [Azospirillum endophyticum]